MDQGRHTGSDPELEAVAQRLRRERPELSGVELDRTWMRVRAGAKRARQPWFTNKKENFMRSRLALTATLALGLLMCSGGAGLAVSGVSSDGSAGKAQYPEATDGGARLGESAADAPPSGSGDGPPTIGGVQGRSANSGDPGREADGGREGDSGTGAPSLQPTRQLEQGGDGELPFTGLAAIPLILVGLTLLVTGAVLRRRLPQRA